MLVDSKFIKTFLQTTSFIILLEIRKNLPRFVIKLEVNQRL